MGVADEHPPGRDWLAIISRPTLAEFAGAFTEGAVLEASVLAAPIVGAPGIRAFFEATRVMYDRIQFMSEHLEAQRTWLEWQGEYLGLPVAGVTVLITGAGGAIACVRRWCASKRRARFPQTPSCYAMTGWRRTESGPPVASIRFSTATPIAASFC